MTAPDQTPLLAVENLTVHFTTRSGTVQGARGVTFEVARGETLGIVGESGSGKSVSVQAVMGLIHTPGEIVAGDIRWKGRSLLDAAGREYLKKIRGREIAMVFQDPMTSLNPVFTVGTQITEVLRRHLGLDKRRARERAAELLELVDIGAPARRLTQYPHELSGGMRQRVMIAMALACEPELLIADEPTTALDVTIQAQILELIADLQERLNLSVIMITHDLGVIAQLCHRVAVMYAGMIVEVGQAEDIFSRPAHPYTQGLLRATPRPDRVDERMTAIEGVPPNLISPPIGCAFAPPLRAGPARLRLPARPFVVRPGAAGFLLGGGRRGDMTGAMQHPAGGPLVKADGITVQFDVGRSGFWGQHKRIVHAVENVHLEVFPGETLGLVGESGSGKSTTGRAILRRVPLAAGRVFFKGKDITKANEEDRRRLSRHMQLVFQDPYASLNPRMRIADIVAEPLLVHGLAKTPRAAADRVATLLERVGLPPDAGSRYPHAFSGGQRQRVGIARALALSPEFIVADEPVSALDVSIRAQVVNLLQDLQAELGLTYLFIAHDLAVVRHISHRIAIMYAGQIVELAGRDAIYDSPVHPYTEALLSAVPIPDPKVQKTRKRLAYAGEAPNPLNPPPGCRFQTRCPLVTAICRREKPQLIERRPGQWAACWNR